MSVDEGSITYLGTAWDYRIEQYSKEPCQLACPSYKINMLKHLYVGLAPVQIVFHSPPSMKSSLVVPPFWERQERKERNAGVKHVKSNILKRINI